MAERNFLLALHDIAPATWQDYRPFVEAIDAMGNIPMTWLVVPDFHHQSATFEDTAFQNMLEQRLARGDELVLHGFFHCDDGPAPRTPHEYFMRRIYTYEGEFYGLARDEAQRRLEQGMELFERRGWPLHGFVAPAWLMSQGTRDALSALPLSYTTDTAHIYRLPEFEAIDVPTLVWSARSRWRRGMSWVVNELARHRHRQRQAIRLGLHPVDMRHSISHKYWLETVSRLLEEGYTPRTKIGWLNHLNLESRHVA
ncbi:DUF2334 domain-containing protein [Phytohalomonas tamaricis]|uniref:DUF2334 domain-containing protein n=1 Tax=Phytohalomonas tamaricis TaxID=2081032 RepID=UPI000D0B14F0|nr:polysaccharide deacetylase family protein [Phytohalomonas tamaricis]